MTYSSMMQDMIYDSQDFFKRKFSGEAFYITNVKRLLKNNFDCRNLVIGTGGMGKSWFSIKCAEKITPSILEDRKSFIDVQVCFKAEDWLLATKTLPKGSVLVMDEPGQAWFAREYMTEVNRLLAKTMIGFRFKKYVTYYCIPFIGLIDKTARILCNYKIDIVDRDKRASVAEIYKIHPSRFQDNIWYKNLGELKVKPPDVRLRNLYEKKKAAAQDEVYDKYYVALVEKGKGAFNNDDIMEIILGDPDKFKSDGIYHIPTMRIQLEELGLHIGREKAQIIKGRLEKREGAMTT